jgi:hypothetical protein
MREFGIAVYLQITLELFAVPFVIARKLLPMLPTPSGSRFPRFQS